MPETTHKPVIFLAFANDRDDTVGYLRNLPEEARQIREPLQRARRDGLCAIVELANATADDIFRVFQDPEYRDRIAVFHYGGHANGYQLLLESASGSSHAADAGGLAAFFGQQRGLDLVFLNGCSTQQQVQGLLDANVSAVIATSRAIDDSVAMQFSRQFYQGLAGGASIRTAYNEAEAAVQTTKGGNTRSLYFGKADEKDLESSGTDRWPWELYLADGAENVANWSLPEAAGDPLFGLPALPQLDLPDSPFCNLNWFDRERAEVFFGRGHQIRELYELVTAAGTAPIVLLYGQSGVGKSSMLAAGLIPRLEATCEVRYLRRDQQVGLLGTLRSCFVDAGKSAAFSESIHFAQDWLEMERQLGKPLVIIIDQVEEAVTRPNPELPHEAEDFLNELESMFGKRQERPAGRLIFGFRKEWLAEIETRLAERKLPRAKVFLERLGRLGVMEAVQGPTRSRRLRDQYGLTVEDGLAEIIADDLLEDSASAIAPTLQILLTKMWANATEANYEHPHFSQELYQSLKREGLLLRDFLDQQIERFRQKYPDVVNSGLLLDMLALHTTSLGTANQCSTEQLEPAYSGLGHELTELLRQCQDLYLLTTAADANRETKPWTRLSHDTLAPLVRERFDKADAPGQRARRVLLNRVPDWEDGKEGHPLDETDLAIVEAGRTGMRQWTADEQRLVAASRKLRARRKRGRRILRLAGFAAMGIIVLVGLIAIWQARVARHNTVTAHFLVAGGSCNQGQPADGLYWFWRAYSDANRNDPRRLNARNLIGSWSRSLGMQLRHDHTVTAAAFSPNSKLVVTGGSDGMSQLWDVSTGNPQGEPLSYDSGVSAVAFSPDGQTLLTAYIDGTAQCWNVATGTPQGDSLPHDTAVTALVFLPGSKTVLTGDADGTVRRWDAATGKEIPGKQPLPQDKSGKVLAFSFDGQTVLTADDNNTAQLWDMLTGDSLGQLLGHEAAINAAVFSADGRKVLTGSDDKTARVWEASTGMPLGEPFRFRETIVSVAFSPDANGSMVLTGSGANTARLWSTAKRTMIGEPLRHEGTVASVAFSPDGNKIITGSWDNTARLWEVSNPQTWDVTSGDARGNPLPHDGRVLSVAFSRDGQTVLTGCSDTYARLWSTSTRELKEPLLAHAGPVNAVAYSVDGRLLLTGSQDKTARLWEATTGETQGKPLQHNGSVLAVALSPDGRTALTGSADNTARLWDATTGEPLGAVLQHDRRVNCVAFSPSGRLVLTGSDDRTARLWDATTGEPHGAVLQHGDRVNSVAFRPDGNSIVTGSDDSTARLWYAATGLTFGEVMQHNEPVNAAIFTPDGKYVITSSDDNTARLWDATSGEPQGEPMRHGGPVNAAAASPVSQTVVTVSDDNTARLWDAVTGQPRGEPLRHAASVSAVAFSPDGQTVITGSDDKTAQPWNVPPPAEDDPVRLKISVEVRTGYYTDAHGTHRTLDQARWLDRKRKLDALGGPCDIRRWEDLTPAELRASGAMVSP